jgi:transcriptional regulator of acetoin/glycerol metabolism
MRDIEKDAIINALTLSNGNVVKAARALGLGQATVYRKMKRYKIRVERTARSDDYST